MTWCSTRPIFDSNHPSFPTINLLQTISLDRQLYPFACSILWLSSFSLCVCIQALVYRRSLPLHIMPGNWEWGPEKTKEWEKKSDEFFDSMNNLPQLEDIPSKVSIGRHPWHPWRTHRYWIWVEHVFDGNQCTVRLKEIYQCKPQHTTQGLVLFWQLIGLNIRVYC